MTTFREREAGSAAVELALVLPLALFAALALVQVGLLAKDSLAVANSAREGAREAAVSTDDARVREAAIRGGDLSEDRAVVAVERSGGMGAPVTVTVRYRSPLLVPFIEWLFPDTVTLLSTATMRQETD
jgi:Flp pilus assembly protein TadG